MCLSVLSNRSQAQVFFTQVSIERELDHPRLPCLIPTCSALLSLAVGVSWSVPASLCLALPPASKASVSLMWTLLQSPVGLPPPPLPRYTPTCWPLPHYTDMFESPKASSLPQIKGKCLIASHDSPPGMVLPTALVSLLFLLQSRTSHAGFLHERGGSSPVFWSSP